VARARQDHPAPIEALSKLNRPYMVALPLVFQTTQEWEESDLGLHPVQVALADRHPRTRWRESSRSCSPAAMTPPARPTPPGPGRSDRRAGDPLGLAAHQAPAVTKKLAITVFQLPARQGQRGHRGLPRCLRLDPRVLEEMKRQGYDVAEPAAGSKAHDGSGDQ